MCLLQWKSIPRLSKGRTTTRIKSSETSSIQNSVSAFEVTLNSSSWSKLANAKHFKARGSSSHSRSCTSMCRWQGKSFSVPETHPHPTSHRIPPGVTNEGQKPSDRYRVATFSWSLTVAHDLTNVTSLSKNGRCQLFWQFVALIETAYYDYSLKTGLKRTKNLSRSWKPRTNWLLVYDQNPEEFQCPFSREEQVEGNNTHSLFLGWAKPKHPTGLQRCPRTKPIQRWKG